MFGVFEALRKLGFTAPESDGTLPLYIKDVKTGEAFYYDHKAGLYVDDEFDPPKRFPRGVASDVVEEPGDYAGVYELSEARIKLDGTILPVALNPLPEAALAELS